MPYQGNPVETTLPVSSANILDGTIQQADLDSVLSNKIDSAITSVKTVNDTTLVGSGNVDTKSETAVVIGTNTTAVAFSTYTFTASLTLTLPASPVIGQWVKVIDRSGTTTSVVARNGSLILGVAEDFTCDIANFFATFLYIDSARGWVLV